MGGVRRSLVLVLALAALAACGGSSTESTASLPRGGEHVTLDPADFTTDIDNAYWPMKPGTRWTYHEIDTKGNVSDVVVVVTTKTKKVANGVTARVVRDTVRRDGEILEDTFDWYAQDRDGNVWYLGEQTAEFEHGEVASTEGSFEAGADGAEAGIIVPAHPKAGLAYREEYLKGEAEDNGEVLGVDEMVEAPYGQFDGALLVKDTSSIEPDVLEYKLYAKGVGLVLTVTVSGGNDREELVSVDQAPADAGTGPLGHP